MFVFLVLCANYEGIADLLNSRHIFNFLTPRMLKPKKRHPPPHFPNFELKFQHCVRTAYRNFFKYVPFCFLFFFSGDFVDCRKYDVRKMETPPLDQKEQQQKREHTPKGRHMRSKYCVKISVPNSKNWRGLVDQVPVRFLARPSSYHTPNCF